MRAAAFALICLMGSTLPALAADAERSTEWRQLKGAELRDAYQGQTIDLVYNTVGFTQTAHHSETHLQDLWRAKGANRENGPSCDIFVS